MQQINRKYSSNWVVHSTFRHSHLICVFENQHDLVVAQFPVCDGKLQGMTCHCLAAVTYTLPRLSGLKTTCNGVRHGLMELTSIILEFSVSVPPLGNCLLFGVGVLCNVFSFCRRNTYLSRAFSDPWLQFAASMTCLIPLTLGWH